MINKLDYKIKIEEPDSSSINISLSVGQKPTTEIIEYITTKIKKMERDKQNIKINYINNASDESGLTGGEIEDQLSIVALRFKKINSLSLNLSFWCYMYSILPKMLEPMNKLKDLKKLQILGNNRSLTPSFSNSALKNLSKILQATPNLSDLHLEFSDNSPQKKKLIKEEGIIMLTEAFRKLNQLKNLNLNFNSWMCAQRCLIAFSDELNKLIFNLFVAIFQEKSFESLDLNLSYWEGVGFQPLIKLFDLVKDQKKLKSLGLRLFRWSYFNDSFSEQAVSNLSFMIYSLKNLKELKLALFDTGSSRVRYQENPEDGENFPTSKLETIVKALQTQQSLHTFHFLSLEYIPFQGMKFIRDIFLIEKHSMKNLIDLQIITDCTQDEYNDSLRTIINKFRNKKRILNSIIPIRKTLYRKFRREIIWEIIQQYYY